MIPRWLSNLIVGTVSLVWAANFFAQFFVPSYHMDPSINGVFGAIVGSALALSRRAESKEQEHDEPHQLP